MEQGRCTRCTVRLARCKRRRIPPSALRKANVFLHSPLYDVREICSRILHTEAASHKIHHDSGIRWGSVVKRGSKGRSGVKAPDTSYIHTLHYFILSQIGPLIPTVPSMSSTTTRFASCSHRRALWPSLR